MTSYSGSSTFYRNDDLSDDIRIGFRIGNADASSVGYAFSEDMVRDMYAQMNNGQELDQDCLTRYLHMLTKQRSVTFGRGCNAQTLRRTPPISTWTDDQTGTTMFSFDIAFQDCTNRAEKMAHPLLNKSEPCKIRRPGGKCNRTFCAFYHNENERRIAAAVAKTILSLGYAPTQSFDSHASTTRSFDLSIDPEGKVTTKGNTIDPLETVWDGPISSCVNEKRPWAAVASSSGGSSETEAATPSKAVTETATETWGDWEDLVNTTTYSDDEDDDATTDDECRWGAGEAAPGTTLLQLPPVDAPGTRDAIASLVNGVVEQATANETSILKILLDNFGTQNSDEVMKMVTAAKTLAEDPIVVASAGIILALDYAPNVADSAAETYRAIVVYTICDRFKARA